MKKQVIDYHVDSFTDYEGNERRFIVAAISFPHDKFKRAISIGVSICHKDDEFDENLGVKFALKNAKKSNIKVFATVGGIVTTKLVDLLLEQEASYFKENPASHIPGYTQMEKEYKEAKALEDLEQNLNDNQKKLLKGLKDLSKDEIDNVIKCIGHGLK